MTHCLIWLAGPLALAVIVREVRRSAWRTLRDRYVDGGPYVTVVYRTTGADDTPYVTAMGTTVLDD